ncbi:hypothetical protein JCM12856_02030 [Spirochaeta dissipatitropha]
MPAAAASDYSLQADFDFGLVHISEHSLAGAPGNIEGDILIPFLMMRADHRILYEWGEFAVRHSFASTGPMPGAAVHELQQLSVYLWALDPLTLRLGRISAPWSFGYVFEPSNALHVSVGKSWFDGAAVTWTFSPDWSLTGILRADTAFPSSDFRWGLRLNGYVGGVESHLSALYQPGKLLRPSAGLSYSLGPLVLHAEAAAELIGEDSGMNGLLQEGAAVESLWSSGVSVLDGSQAGYALSGGLNWQHYIGLHGLSAVLDYVYTSAPPADSGNQLVFVQAAYDYDQRFSFEQALILTKEMQRAMSFSSVTVIPYDSLEFTAGIMAASDFGSDSVSDWWKYQTAWFGTRVYY